MLFLTISVRVSKRKRRSVIFVGVVAGHKKWDTDVL